MVAIGGDTLDTLFFLGGLGGGCAGVGRGWEEGWE